MRISPAPRYAMNISGNQYMCMLTWALIFFILAIVAGLFGFGFIASAFAGLAQIFFFLFLALFIGSLLFRLADKGDRTVERNLR